MSMRVAPKINLSDEQREALEKLVARPNHHCSIGYPSEDDLMANAGKQTNRIADELAIARQTVARWRGRFIASGIAGIEKDAPRPVESLKFCPAASRRSLV